MKSITVYRVETHDLGDKIMMEPWIPDGLEGEDRKTERIPVCQSIYGCLMAMEMLSKLSGRWPEAFEALTETDKIVRLFLYSAVASVRKLSFPNKEVPDQFYTGELWLTGNTEFESNGCIFVRKLLDIPTTAYSKYGVIWSPNRYSTGKDIDWSILKPKSSMPITGVSKAFTYIMQNPMRISLSKDCLEPSKQLEVEVKRRTGR